MTAQRFASKTDSEHLAGIEAEANARPTERARLLSNLLENARRELSGELKAAKHAFRKQAGEKADALLAETRDYLFKLLSDEPRAEALIYAASGTLTGTVTQRRLLQIVSGAVFRASEVRSFIEELDPIVRRAVAAAAVLETSRAADDGSSPAPARIAAQVADDRVTKLFVLLKSHEYIALGPGSDIPTTVAATVQPIHGGEPGTASAPRWLKGLPLLVAAFYGDDAIIADETNGEREPWFRCTLKQLAARFKQLNGDHPEEQSLKNVRGKADEADIVALRRVIRKIVTST